MSGKLDQSLDQIMTDSKTSRGRKGARPRTRRVAATKAKAAIAAPSGGISKNTKAPKAPKATLPAVTNARESKIIVSNLPEDVSEGQIKDYFGQTVGSVRKVLLTYGPNGRSRGVATIFFSKAESASKAAKELHGVKVDGKPMRIELVLGAQYAPKAPVPKSLAERATMPNNATKTNAKAKPKSAAAKPATNGTTKAGTKKSGRAGRPKKKTAAELDAEMVDYFGGDAGAANGAAAAAPAAAVADTGMVDEVM